MDFYRLLFPGHNGDPVGWVVTNGSEAWGKTDSDDVWERDDDLIGVVFGFVDTPVVAVRSEDPGTLPPIPTTD